MTRFYTKVKLILFPYFIVLVTLIAGYTFLNWLLVIELKKIKVDEMIINLLVPLLLPWLPLLIWFRPRLKMLDFKSGIKNPVSGVIYLTGIAIIVPLIFLQFYIFKEAGKLTPLNNISEVIRPPETKYYTVKQSYINKRLVHVKSFFEVSGKYNDSFNMTIYAAVPVFSHLFPDTNKIAAIRNSVDTNTLIIINGSVSTMKYLKTLPADSIRIMRYLNPSLVMPRYGNAGRYGAIMTITPGYKTKRKLSPPPIAPSAWLALKYTQTVSNHLSPQEKENAYKAFALNSQYNFNKLKLSKFTYLNRPRNGRDLKNFIAAVQLRGDVVAGMPVILYPVFDSFANRSGHTLLWFLISLAIGSFIMLLVIHFNGLKAKDF